MEMMRVLRALMRWWWLVLIPVAIVAVFAVPDLLQNEQSGAGGYQTNFRYSAAQVASNVTPREGDYQDVWLASEFVVNAFTEWVRTSSFRQALDAQVADSVDVAPLGISSDNQRSIGVVYLSHPDAAALEAIANAAVDVLQNENAAYFPHLGDEPADVTLLDAPVVTPVPPPLTSSLAPVIQLGVAFLAGVGLATLAIYLDPTLRTRDDLAAQGVRVLGSIPRER